MILKIKSTVVVYFIETNLFALYLEVSMVISSLLNDHILTERDLVSDTDSSKNHVINYFKEVFPKFLSGCHK